MERTNYNIFLIGEYFNKKEFLSECMSDRLKPLFFSLSEQYNAPIIINGSAEICQTIGYDSKSKILHGVTNKLPAHVSISCENKDDKAVEISRKNYTQYDKIVFIASWQYEYGPFDDMVSSIPDIINRNPFIEILLVLLKSNVQSGFTDLGTQDSAIEHAFNRYKKQYQNVMIMKHGDSLLNIVRPKFQIADSVCKEYYEVFKVWTDNLKDEKFGLRFDLEIKIETIKEKYINSTVLERDICGLSAIANSGDIVKSYSDNFLNKYFDSAEKIVLDFYKDAVESICVWDMDKDIEYLKKNFREMYKKKTLPADISKPIPAPKNIIDYNDITNKFAVRTKFYTRLSEFYEKTVVDFVVEHLSKKTEKIEKYLDKIYSSGEVIL